MYDGTYLTESNNEFKQLSEILQQSSSFVFGTEINILRFQNVTVNKQVCFSGMIGSI